MISKDTHIGVLSRVEKELYIARPWQDTERDVHRFQCTISIKSEMKPIPGRISLLSSASSAFAQMGMLAIPQGQIVGSGFGTPSCSSKIGGMGSGSSDPGIFGGSCCSLGGVVCLCEAPGCCPAFWGLLGGLMNYHAKTVSRVPEETSYPSSTTFTSRYLPYLEIIRTGCLLATPRSPFSTSFRARGAILIHTR